MSRVSAIHHINMQITDIERSKEWYGKVFGVKREDIGADYADRMLELYVGTGEFHLMKVEEPIYLQTNHAHGFTLSIIRHTRLSRFWPGRHFISGSKRGSGKLLSRLAAEPEITSEISNNSWSLQVVPAAVRVCAAASPQLGGWTCESS